jgi:hypothetical protein
VLLHFFEFLLEGLYPRQVFSTILLVPLYICVQGGLQPLALRAGMWLAREPRAGSGEQGAGIVVRNPEIDKFHQKKNFILMFLLKNSNFSRKLDLLPWVQTNLLPYEIKESTCEREGELKIKFEKERMQATERNLENLK